MVLLFLDLFLLGFWILAFGPSPRYPPSDPASQTQL